MMDARSRVRLCDAASGLWTALAVGLAALLAGPAQADWADDFDGGFVESWIFDFTDDAGSAPATGTSTFAVVDDGADDYLRISHTTTGIAGGGGGATDGFGLVNESFSDVWISADVNAKPSIGQQSLLGVLARGNPGTGTAYTAVVDFANSLFAIALVDFELIPLAVDFAVEIDPAETYRIDFLILGSDLYAGLTRVSTGEGVSFVSTQDTSFASGVSGVFVQTGYDGADNPIGPIVGSFDRVEAVPEPGLAIGLLCGVGALALWGRR